MEGVLLPGQIFHQIKRGVRVQCTWNPRAALTLRDPAASRWVSFTESIHFKFTHIFLKKKME